MLPTKAITHPTLIFTILMFLPKYSDYRGLVLILVIWTYLELKQGFKLGENQNHGYLQDLEPRGKLTPWFWKVHLLESELVCFHN